MTSKHLLSAILLSAALPLAGATLLPTPAAAAHAPAPPADTQSAEDETLLHALVHCHTLKLSVISLVGISSEPPITLPRNPNLAALRQEVAAAELLLHTHLSPQQPGSSYLIKLVLLDAQGKELWFGSPERLQRLEVPSVPLLFTDLSHLISISKVEVCTDGGCPSVTVEFSNNSEQDIYISQWGEEDEPPADPYLFSIGEYDFLTCDEPDELSIPAKGTRRVRFTLANDMPFHYEPDEKLYNAHPATVNIALQKGGNICYTYAVKTWKQGNKSYTGGSDVAALLTADLPSPKAAPKPLRIPLPAAPYKAGDAALADIRSIYDTATYHRVFNVRAEGLKPFADYLQTGKPTTELLHLACRYNCPDLVEELIARGVEVNTSLPDPDEPDSPLRSALYHAALPSYYSGNAESSKARRIIDLLLDAGAKPELGACPLPEVVGFGSAHAHMERVFLHLLDRGISMEDKRLTPEQRQDILEWLAYRRGLGQPWQQVEQRLGLNIPPPLFPEPTQGGSELVIAKNYHFEAIGKQEDEALRQTLAAARRIRLSSPACASLELKPVEAARLLETLRRVPQWHRCVEYLDEERTDSGIRLEFCDAEGRPLANALPDLHELYYAEGSTPIRLGALMQRYLPECDASLPLAQQIKVLGYGGKYVFVIDGESTTSIDELKKKASAELDYELLFTRKHMPQDVKALQLELSDSIRIAHCSVPSSAGRSIRGEFRKAEANPLEHIAPLNIPPEKQAWRNGSGGLVCELGGKLLIYMEDYGSGVDVNMGNVYRKDAKGQWELLTDFGFSSLGKVTLTLHHNTLYFLSPDGKPHLILELPDKKP